MEVYRLHDIYGEKKVPLELNKYLEREIKLARNIQMKLLNGEQPHVEDGQLTGISIPARLIGGDYYDFYLLPNGKLRIIIGDVMGKGIPAAMLMILTRGAFRSAAESTKGPGETLTAMNKALFKDLRALGSFVTLFCADWDAETNQLTYANAGHLPPIIIDANKEVREPIEVKGVMLGGLATTIYQEAIFSLQAKDVVLFYTDGIIEARNHEKEMYRIDRLRKILVTYHDYQVKEIEQQLIQSIEQFVKEELQQDDITMVLLKIEEKEANLIGYNAPMLQYGGEP